ncbi:MAG: hypothetical protein JST63_11820 [Bacteroidetes bacterium]|nr:hypothetical protein [Bacteroidota bacterium]
MDIPKWKAVILRIAQIVSNILKSLWLFFPSVLFLLLVTLCFWMLSQGKDLIIAFTENGKAKVFFFIAIAFWVYVTWYSSRIIAYIKKSQQDNYIRLCNPGLEKEKLSAKYQLRAFYLNHIPWMLGFACFLVIAFAIIRLALPGSFIVKHILVMTGILLLLLGFMGWINRRTDDLAKQYPKLFSRFFWIVLITFLIVLTLLSFFDDDTSIWWLFTLVIWLFIIFLLYTNLKERDMELGEIKLEEKRDSWISRVLKSVMRWLNLADMELGYFKWFNIICAIGFLVYIAVIISFGFSVFVGPFPFVLLAFAVLLGFGNFVTALSVKSNVNLHFIIFLLAAVFSSSENHRVRTVSLNKRMVSPDIFDQRPTIQQYFINWLQLRNEIDSVDSYPVYFVLGNGGATRSAYWVTSVLGRLEDASLAGGSRFSRHIFCLSGTSGGGVGMAAFYKLLYDAQKNNKWVTDFEASGKEFLGQDYLTYTLARMLGPDYFKYIIHWSPWGDRAAALEYSFENSVDNGVYKLHFSTPLDSFITKDASLPVFCINTTRMQDGTPGVVSNIKMDSVLFNKRVDVLSLLQDSLSIRMSTAAILGARFPYISPAGRIDNKINGNKTYPNYFVDGGYFDNSGAGVVQEMIAAISKVADTCSNQVLQRRIKKLKLIVLHITNSPLAEADLKNVVPLKNDLAAPILTILGAYDMQTTVNDRRLENFIADINLQYDSSHTGFRSAAYIPIDLYNNPAMNAADTLPYKRSLSDTLPSNGPYAMNWFISKDVQKRMDQRLKKQPALDSLVRLMQSGK